MVGISAPQGCGKSTLVAEMRRMLEKAGHSCAMASIDDFYLTGTEQVSSLVVTYGYLPIHTYSRWLVRNYVMVHV